MRHARTQGIVLLTSAIVLACAMDVLAAPGDVSVAWVQPTAGISIASDADDNVFTVTYVYALGGDIIVTKRSSDGAQLWSVSYDNAQSPFWERATWITTDSGGNAIVSSTMMSGYSNPVNAASVVTKFSGEGDIVWRHVFESSFDGSWTRKCLVDEADNIYVLGMGSGPGGFVTKVKKFAPDGAPVWSHFDAAGIGMPINFKIAPGGDLVMAGRSAFGSLNGYSRISSDGEHLWSVAGVQSLTIGDCAADSLGNAYLVHGEYRINGGTVIRKVDSAGATLWNRTYGLSGFRIEVGSDDRAVVSGFPSTTTGGAAFIKVDESGSLVWANLDADGPDLALLLHAQMVLDDQDNAYLAAGTLFEMAVCKVTSAGDSAWTATVTGSYANAMTLSNDQSGVFVVGGATAP